MTILALEFSSPQRSVAVARGGQPVAEAVESGGAATSTFGLIEKLLADAKTQREQIEAVVVGLGPGSYTGIRAALSIAQGWQLAREVKLLGVSSVEAIAAQAQMEKIFGRVNVVIDAQRNEIYLATYEISVDARREIAQLKIVRPPELAPCQEEVFIGPEVTRWFSGGKIIFPGAAALARLASAGNDFAQEENLEPIYLRPTEFVKVTPKGSSKV